jgi:aminopeptidase-like protein
MIAATLTFSTTKKASQPVDLGLLKKRVNSGDIGQEIYRLVAELYPICRSITGDGLRASLHLLKQHIPLEIHEVPSGTAVFDWTVPEEWNIKDAYVKDSAGTRIIDFKKSNLHVVNYSAPIKRRLSFEELKPHVFTLPDRPEWIPYRTSYYQESWGFCMAHNDFVKLAPGAYDVCIDSTLAPGHLSYGEYYIQGELPDEVLISCHTCHPSLCNDNLSGVAVATLLAKHLGQLPLRYSYRFLFAPGTIGTIAWLSYNQDRISRVKHGLVLVDMGDGGKFTYKKSRRGDGEIDRAVVNALKDSGHAYQVREFDPYGHDERQYCSPGINLPVGCFSRTPHGEFAEYHTSADNLDFVKPEYLGSSFKECISILHLLENNRKYVNLNPMGEPQLGKRGLYRMMGGGQDSGIEELPLLWVLNLSDGGHSLLDISDRSGLSFDAIKIAADALLERGLLKPVDA